MLGKSPRPRALSLGIQSTKVFLHTLDPKLLLRLLHAETRTAWARIRSNLSWMVQWQDLRDGKSHFETGEAKDQKTGSVGYRE